MTRDRCPASILDRWGSVWKCTNGPDCRGPHAAMWVRTDPLPYPLLSWNDQQIAAPQRIRPVRQQLMPSH